MLLFPTKLGKYSLVHLKYIFCNLEQNIWAKKDCKSCLIQIMIGPIYPV